MHAVCKKMQGYRIQDSGCILQTIPMLSVANSALYLASCILYPVSCIDTDSAADLDAKS